MKSLRHDSILPHPYFVLLLLATVILAVYYPAITSGIHSIDDPGVVARFSSPPSLADILLPGRTYYYRPIIELSYYLDSKLWEMEPIVMHLENVLLHVLNALLVFIISRTAAVTQHPELNPYIPVLAAFLFALHPLNVEAVSWIAGRTDPLAAFFILSACLLWLRWLETPKWYFVVCAALLFVLGTLTKESALAFLPGSLLILIVWPSVSKKRKRLAACAIVLSMVMLLLAALTWKSGVVSLGRFFSYHDFNIFEWFHKIIVVFGFYVKKLLMPLPLNFAITEVSQLYGLLGIITVIILVAAFFLRRLNSLFICISALMVLPALLVATQPIAWTPYAERYMYMPTAFLSIGIVSQLYFMPNRKFSTRTVIILLIVCFAGVVSFQRNMLWNDKRAFYLDAVAKSPQFGSLYNELGKIYFGDSQITEAAEAFGIADRLNTRPSMIIPIKSNIMATLIAQGNYLAARDFFFTICEDKKEATAALLELLYRADNRRLEALAHNEKILLAYDLLETLELLQHKKPDAFWHYRSGQIALSVGEIRAAESFFRNAFNSAPADAYFKAAAKKYMLRLEARK